jgi:hypothetical protein
MGVVNGENHFVSMHLESSASVKATVTDDPLDDVLDHSIY